MTGTDPNGRVSSSIYTCNNWTTTTGSTELQLGSSMAGPLMWSAANDRSCSTYTYSVLCMMRQFTTGTTAATFPGKRVWLSNTLYAVSATNSPDAICTNDRPSGVATGRALITRTTSTAASLLGAMQMYVRPDGQEVGTGAEIIAGQARGGIWEFGNGSYPTTYLGAWTGSPGLDQLGSVASTCNNWTDPNQTAGLSGSVLGARTYFWASGPGPCNSQHNLFCYEP